MSVTLRGITWEHARGYGSVAASARAYREVAPGVEVRWEQRSLQSFADQALEDLVEQYDLLVIDHPHIPHAAEHGLLARLDGVGHDDELALLQAQSVGASHATYAHAGGQWGLATDAAAQVAAYRPDLLPEPPRDWAGVIALAEQGRVLWPYKPVDAFSSLVTVAAGYGEEAMRAPGCFLTADALAEAMDLLRRLARLVPDDNRAWNPIQTADALSTSDRYAYCPLLFGYTNYSRGGFRPHRLRYIDIPASRRGVSGSLLGGAGIAVSARSRALPEAIDYAFWLDSAAVQEGVYYDGGGQPGNAVAWESERTNADSLDFFRGTRATLEGAYVRPRFARYIELQNALSEHVTDALVGRLTDDELRARLDEGVEQWLELT
ncbi:extracellular solute-binding protein [Microbacterium telephonicum]|uniref:Carbohydrate ABC transporter substrate-binding protein (CUT1 family) n=1 Tax=Microbacterium telephonicum TaxID=1714841 RepID=A0A498BRK2_9MICO|nr:extracellular solute-binding protein [Microbacterium telephonicum]RLK46575.1 carbohydrate ABC transporter substrate-binding protein (CUT1 family) [Microbacterium telephonicum]